MSSIIVNIHAIKMFSKTRNMNPQMKLSFICSLNTHYELHYIKIVFIAHYVIAHVMTNTMVYEMSMNFLHFSFLFFFVTKNST